MAESVMPSGAELVYVNQKEGLNRLVNNTKLYARLLAKFKAETSLDGLNAAVSAGDYETARVIAHTLKGVAGNLSLTEFVNRIKDAEERIKEGNLSAADLEGLERCLGETAAAIDRVLEQYG
jgi:HPt (histidine-containing phosphotransfer) domain-containing protein